MKDYFTNSSRKLANNRYIKAQTGRIHLTAIFLWQLHVSLDLELLAHFGNLFQI